MIILFILGLVLGGCAVVFALENVTVITVTFFSWSLTSSLSIIVLLSILSGILITLLIVLPGSVNNYFNYRKLKKEIVRLQEELRKQKEKTIFAKDVPPTQNDIDKIEEGVIEKNTL